MLQELEEAAWFYGLLPTDTGAWSPYELMCYVRAGRKRDQQTARFLHTLAALIPAGANGKMPEVWEAFPLWDKADIYRSKAERITRTLMSKAVPVKEVNADAGRIS